MGESNGNTMENQLMKSLELFVNEVDKYSNLTIVAEEEKDGAEVLVLENTEVPKDVEGHQITVEVSEIFAKCVDEKSVTRFVKVVNCDANPLVCHGITRIVGYYSRVSNWNKSKIGELRDRLGENYALSGKTPEHEEARLALVDNA